MSKKEEDVAIWILVLLLVLFIVIYVVSLGTLNNGKVNMFPVEFKDSKEEVKRKHKRLKELLDKQQALKSRLEKRFKRTYFFVRLFFILIWAAGLFILFVFRVVNNIGDALNYSEACILVMVVLYFLIFGSISSLENFIDLIKSRVENLVCGKYININEKIELNISELEKLNKEIGQ
jgi:polyferredoxin